MNIGKIIMAFDPGEEDTAALIGSACEKAVQLAKENWGLETAWDCRIYVMDSWLKFVFQSAPWPWRILLGVDDTVLVLPCRRTWLYSAAWTQRYGKRAAIG